MDQFEICQSCNWVNVDFGGKIKLGLAWCLRIILIPSKADVSPTLITVGFPEQVDRFSVMAPWASLLSQW